VGSAHLLAHISNWRPELPVLMAFRTSLVAQNASILFGIVLCLFALTSLAPVSAGKRIETGKVRVLDSTNFEHDTQASTGMTTGDWFVEFYAPWCGHCKKLTPIWDRLAETLKKKVTIAKVDVTKNRILGKRFGIQGFPTLIFFSKGKMYKYRGMRTVEKLKEFAMGGHKKLEPLDIPPEPSAWVGLAFWIIQKYTKLNDVHPALGLLGLAGLGLLLAVIMISMAETFRTLLCPKTKMPVRAQKNTSKQRGADGEAAKTDTGAAAATDADTGESKQKAEPQSNETKKDR